MCLILFVEMGDYPRLCQGDYGQEVGRHMDTSTSTLGGDIAHIVHSDPTRNRLTFLHTQN